ncbi:MAG: hypothetical protein Fur0042_26800 [Cyanophyceae cyanobacterium]
MRELLERLKLSAHFLTDANGRPTAIVLDLSGWQQLLALLERFIESRAAPPISQARPSALSLIGLAKTDQMPPSDHEVSLMLEDYRQKKYDGQNL